MDKEDISISEDDYNDEDEDVEQASSVHSLEYYPMEAMEKIKPLVITPETVRDPKKLIHYLEFVKINIDS